METETAPTVPLHQYTTRSKEGVAVFKGVQDVLFKSEVAAARLFEYSDDGSLLAAVGNSVAVYHATKGDKLFSYESSDVQAVAFSPKNSFLLTWERFKKPEPNQQPANNLLVWEIKSGKQLAAFVQKAFIRETWPSIQWSSDESMCGRVVTNEIQFSPGNTPSQVVNRKRLNNVIKFSFSTDSNFYATFVPEKNSSPASVSIIKYHTGDAAVTKSFFKAQTVEFLWNSAGNSLLVRTETDVDKTGKSYYGESNLHFLKTDGSKNEAIVLKHDGPIHHCAWSPDGKYFLVTYGFMPARSTLFDVEGKQVSDFGSAHRNTAKFSPNGRLLCIAGFGNLQGEMDIWDWKKLRKVGSGTAHCATFYDWSPDSNFLLTAVLSPRIRVDNGYQFWSNDCTLLKKVAVNELYQACWNPSNLGINSPFYSPKPKAETETAKVQPKAAAKPSVYRHPNFSGANTVSLHNKEEAKYVAKPAAAKSNLPPGAEPVLSKSALRNKKKREKKKEESKSKNQTQKDGDDDDESAPTDQAESAEPAEPAEPVSEEERPRRIKTIQKKLKQIQQLKEQQAIKALDQAQLAKVATEQALIAELASYGASTTTK